MSLYMECEELKQKRKEGLSSNFKNICKSILREFEDSTLRCVILENYPEDERITISEKDDTKYCLFSIEYGEDGYLDYVEGIYDLRSQQGFSEFMSDFMYYLYTNTSFEFSEEANSVLIHF